MRQKELVKHCSHIVLWVAAMTYVQCFVLCFREEGPRAVTALYFGWLAFRNCHFVTGGGGGGPPPPIIFIPAGAACAAPSRRPPSLTLPVCPDRCVAGRPQRMSRTTHTRRSGGAGRCLRRGWRGPS